MGLIPYSGRSVICLISGAVSGVSAVGAGLVDAVSGVSAVGDVGGRKRFDGLGNYCRV